MKDPDHHPPSNPRSTMIVNKIFISFSRHSLSPFNIMATRPPTPPSTRSAYAPGKTPLCSDSVQEESEKGCWAKYYNFLSSPPPPPSQGRVIKLFFCFPTEIIVKLVPEMIRPRGDNLVAQKKRFLKIFLRTVLE